MAVVKVRDLTHGRLRSPDLDAQEEFLTAFGMVRAARTPDALYMRGTDPAHHIHVTEKGDPGFIGFAWSVADEDDLKALAKLPGASGIEHTDEPGGGTRVRLTEPNGYTIEVVHGIETLAPIPVARQAINSGAAPLNRAGEVIRFPAAPSTVKRIGLAVLGSPKNQETVRWFREVLGLVCSDDVYAGEKDNVIGQFSRVDAGDDYVDHHAFFCMRNNRAGLNHFCRSGDGHRAGGTGGGHGHAGTEQAKVVSDQVNYGNAFVKAQGQGANLSVFDQRLKKVFAIV